MNTNPRICSVYIIMKYILIDCALDLVGVLVEYIQKPKNTVGKRILHLGVTPLVCGFIVLIMGVLSILGVIVSVAALAVVCIAYPIVFPIAYIMGYKYAPFAFAVTEHSDGAAQQKTFTPLNSN